MSPTIPESQRLEERERYGDLRSMYESALERQRQGDLAGAWDRLAVAMADYLWLLYLSNGGKSGSPIRHPAELAKKLRSGRHIDEWAFRVIPILVQRPKNVEPYQVEMLSTLVKGFCLPNA